MPVLAMFRSIIAYTVLFFSFSTTWTVAKLGRRSRVRHGQATRRLAVTGTFYNHNWFLSHARPLSQCGVEEVLMVADEPLGAPPRVRFSCPPRWLRMVLGRAGAKLVWLIVVGFRDRPDVYMGFHFFPGALTALIVARLFGRQAYYQMTGGSIELIGGGVDNENRLMSRLASASPMLERMALAVAAEFDGVIVRGAVAQRFLAGHGIERHVSIIPGSVELDGCVDRVERDIDMVFVGRLVPIKQPSLFLEVVAAVKRSRPSIRATVVGGGPLEEQLHQTARRLGIEDAMTFAGKRNDVPSFLQRAKVFVLTSRSEGLSIALAEAMTCGVVPVVADVGELRELVEQGRTGYLVEPGDIETFAVRVENLLSDEALLTRMANDAGALARRHHAVPAVAARWAQCLGTGSRIHPSTAMTD